MPDSDTGSKLLQGVQRLVDVNGRVAAEDAVVIVTDPTMETYAALVEEAAKAKGPASPPA